MATLKMLIMPCLVLLIWAPSALASMSVEHDHGHAGHHQSAVASADGAMVIIGSQVSKGVKGMAHLQVVDADAAAAGASATHHFMIAFVAEDSGRQVEQGTVTLKLIDPDAKTSVVEVMPMAGHFGADILLDIAGEYHFRLDTLLVDGVARKYHFHFVKP